MLVALSFVIQLGLGVAIIECASALRMFTALCTCRGACHARESFQLAFAASHIMAHVLRTCSARSVHLALAVRSAAMSP
jgi:hypothetical protein